MDKGKKKGLNSEAQDFLGCFIQVILIVVTVTVTLLATNFKRKCENLTYWIGKTTLVANSFHLPEDKKINLSQAYSLEILRQLLVVSVVVLFTFIATSQLAHIVSLLGFPVHYEILAFAIGLSGSLLLIKTYYRKDKHYHYSFSKKVFYYLTLGIPGVQSFLSSLENLLYRNHQHFSKGIIITGLARSGTTALLQSLTKQPQFRSLTYREMPFLCAPKLWSAMNLGKSKKQERIHGDGITVDLDSPDAFDEYFWRLILKERYYTDNAKLRVHHPKEHEIRRYEYYIKKVLRENETYVAKNNNFVLRVKEFLRKRNEYKIFVVFRDPLSHIWSLYNQHNNILQKQMEDDFLRDYMAWLGHHEFGCDVRDFKLNRQDFKYKSPTSLNYWLERWVNYYNYVLGLEHEKIFYISNNQVYNYTNQESSCTNTLRQVCSNYLEDKGMVKPQISQDLVQSAYSIYAKLKSLETEISKKATE